MQTLVRTPYRGLGLLGNLISFLMGCFTVRGSEGHENTLIPALDIVENQSHYVVRADLPGIKKKICRLVSTINY